MRLSKYFDTIDHEHIRRVLAERFLLTKVERHAIEGFLVVCPSAADAYTSVGGPERTCGIPQGTSISLFLANVAAWELDRELESHGVGFVRYADDTLIWSTDYSRICSAVDVLHQHAEAIGVTINAVKSPGIRLLVPDGAGGELETTHHVDYLGHRISLDGVAMKPAANERIRARVDQLLFHTLLHEPHRPEPHAVPVPATATRDPLHPLGQPDEAVRAHVSGSTATAPSRTSLPS